jgi:hypothetical protein
MSNKYQEIVAEVAHKKVKKTTLLKCWTFYILVYRSEREKNDLHN